MLLNHLIQSMLKGAFYNLIRVAQRDHFHLIEVVGLVPGHRSRSFKLCRWRFYPCRDYKPRRLRTFSTASTAWHSAAWGKRRNRPGCLSPMSGGDQPPPGNLAGWD